MFNICPKEDMPRLFRFTEIGARDVVSVFEKEKNLLFVNLQLFELLSSPEQNIILKTDKKEMKVRYVEHIPHLILD
jgi:hypothetical protein